MLISDLPIYNAPNYAPLKPLLDLKEKERAATEPFTQQIRELYFELNGRDEAVIYAISETAYTIASFMAGKQIWQRNLFNGGRWELVPNTRTDPNKIQSVNIMQFQVSQMLEDLVSSNPDFEPADMFRSYEYEKQVKASKAAWNEYERKFYDSWFNIQQSLALITAGTAIEQVKYDASKKAFQMFREIWGTIEVPITDGFGICFACGYEGRFEDFHHWNDAEKKKDFTERQTETDAPPAGALEAFPQCADCGSFEVEAEPSQRERIPSVVGREQFDIGDFVLNNVPVQSVRFDVSVRPEDSSYFITKQYIPTRKLKHLLGEFKLEAGCESDTGLDLLYKMARIGAPIGGARQELGGDTKPEDNSMLITMSLSPDEAAHIKVGAFADDKKTVSGGRLKKGDTLAEMCPDGCTILGINGMSHIYGIFPVTHKTEISSAVYFAKAGAGTGRGAEDLTEIQKRKNRLDAQQTKAVDGATPGYAFVEGAVDEKDIKMMGIPNAKIPIRREFFNLTKDVNSFVKQFDPQQVAPQLFAYSQEIDKLAQMTAHVVSMGNAVYGANNDTATGARILEATAAAISIPFLQSKAGMRKRTVKNLLYQYKEVFGAIKRDFSLGAGKKQHSRVEVTGADINPEIEFVVVANSEIPQNFYTRKMDYATFTQILGGIPGIMQLKANDPELLRTYAKAFNVDFGDDDYDQIQEICRQRLHQAFELAEMFEQTIQFSQPTADVVPQLPPPSNDNMLTSEVDGNNINADESGLPMATPPPPPEQVLYDLLFSEITPALRPKEKNHLQKADWFAEFLDTTEACAMPEEKRGIILEFILRHEEMDRMNKTGMAAMDAKAQLEAGLPTAIMGKKLEQMSGELEATATAK